MLVPCSLPPNPIQHSFQKLVFVYQTLYSKSIANFVYGQYMQPARISCHARQRQHCRLQMNHPPVDLIPEAPRKQRSYPHVFMLIASPAWMRFTSVASPARIRGPRCSHTLKFALS